MPPSPDAPESSPDHRYVLDNARVEAGERFTRLAELFDGVTRGHFDRLGVRAGWRCWEVGAGGPSIPEALATAVGPTGYVLATDINPAWLNPHGGYEVLRHDIVGDAPPRQARLTWYTRGSCSCSFTCPTVPGRWRRWWRRYAPVVGFW
jgi:hypothetical protein